MIYYRPTDGDPLTSSPARRPRTCFLMTQLGEPIPSELAEIRTAIEKVLAGRGFTVLDAESLITGRDFLVKIWELVVSVPLGIAVVHEEMSPKTLGNIFYELGLMQAYGKDTLVIKTKGAGIPSDFVRTEYLEYGTAFERKLGAYMDGLAERAVYFSQMADLLENNPLLSIDFLRRSYLISADEGLRARAAAIVAGAGLEKRARNSVEVLAASF